VVTRWAVRGTHEGDLMGIAPTGTSIDVTTAGIWLVAGGKISAAWLIYGAFGMMP
jgi:predicted ester cyclase